jgi:hypothetical protein
MQSPATDPKRVSMRHVLSLQWASLLRKLLGEEMEILACSLRLIWTFPREKALEMKHEEQSGVACAAPT